MEDRGFEADIALRLRCLEIAKEMLTKEGNLNTIYLGTAVVYDGTSNLVRPGVFPVTATYVPNGYAGAPTQTFEWKAQSLASAISYCLVCNTFHVGDCPSAATNPYAQVDTKPETAPPSVDMNEKRKSQFWDAIKAVSGR